MSPPDARVAALVASTSAVVLSTHVDPRDDMERERRRGSSLPVGAVSLLLHGGDEGKIKRMAELAAHLEAQPWGDKSLRPFMSRQEEYVSALKAALGIWQQMRSKELSYDDAILARKLVNMPSGFELHIGMFIPTLLSQADAEQQAQFLPDALSLKLVGTYAQTELGHGTYVRGLETTATYDARTRQFVLHTPTLSATKWWPGGLGATATHAVVMARLFCGSGIDRGPHAFVVQVRDMETGKAMPGVKCGDIGPKLGFGSVDNGWLELDHVCIPRRNMLMKYASVSEEGHYSPPPPSNSKASYATMVFVRATIVEEAGWVLARSATIATRYAAVRRQTAPKPGEPEWQVLDYQNTAHDLLPLVAASYALIFAGRAAMNSYGAFDAARASGDFSMLPELHASLAGMKALSTWITSDGAEAARRCCGGHGYSQLSGLPQVFASYVQNVTWEGDNNVMCLQTARFLLKAIYSGREARGKSGGGGNGRRREGLASYVVDADADAAERRRGMRDAPVAAETPGETSSDAVALLRARAAAVAISAADKLERACAPAPPAFEGPQWNGCTVDLIRAARAHCEAELAAAFDAAVEAAAVAGVVGGVGGVLEQSGSSSSSPSSSPSPPLPPEAVPVLRSLCRLHALRSLTDGAAADLLDAGLASNNGFLAACREAVYAELRALRPFAVPLVDAFALPDYLLDSAIGASDGDAYRRLRAAAGGSQLSDSESGKGVGWEPVLRELLAPSLRKNKKEKEEARPRL